MLFIFVRSAGGPRRKARWVLYVPRGCNGRDPSRAMDGPRRGTRGPWVPWPPPPEGLRARQPSQQARLCNAREQEGFPPLGIPCERRELAGSQSVRGRPEGGFQRGKPRRGRRGAPVAPRGRGR
jgi:hypothetical protein